MNKKCFDIPRRGFLKGCAIAAAASAVPAFGLIGLDGSKAAQVSSGVGRRPLDFVDLIIGTGWHGHVFPGAVAPFGLVQLSPDTSGPPERRRGNVPDYYGWNHCSGYHYPDNVILGFSHTHLQGTGGSDLGDILVMPIVEERNWSWDAGIPTDQGEAQIDAIGENSGWVFSESEPGYRSFFSHQTEMARAGYYAVHLETPDVRAELTATTRCGMHRYSYPSLPSHIQQGIIVDLVHGLGSRAYHAELNIESDSRVSGSRSTHGWAQDRQVYFVMEFSRPAASVQVKVDGKVSPAAAGGRLSGEQLQAIFTHTAATEPLILRVGISGTSVEGARKNLAAEIPHWDFDGVVHQNERAWGKTLAAVDATLPDRATSQTFYTGAYHGLVAPATFNDVDGAYRGLDHQNHSNPGFTNYTTLSIWDIYRGEFPFIMLMQSHRTNDIIRTLLAGYQQMNQHSLPFWPLWGNETWSMDGFHAAGMIVGAYVRGFRDFDVQAAYAAIRDTALVGAAVNNHRESQEQFRRYGYVPAGPKDQSVSWTLDYAYDYWCAGAMAELLGKQEDAAMFYKLGRNYRNLFDPKTGFMRARTQDGNWKVPFRPDQEYLDYVETDAWQATFNVMQDVQDLISLYGGDQSFIARLDALFTAPSYVVDAKPDISGMVGQDAQGNEPSNHIPYLYTFAGAAWKTQYWVRRVAALYNNKPAGVPGNDDCGQLSSWFVFAALGFYPVNAATGVYVIGSPLVKHAQLHNANGTSFSIIAENNSPDNLYIQNAMLNGKVLTRSWITYAEIVAGGELRFHMGSKPNEKWASDPADRPPSGLVKSKAI